MFDHMIRWLAQAYRQEPMFTNSLLEVNDFHLLRKWKVHILSVSTEWFDVSILRLHHADQPTKPLS